MVRPRALLAACGVACVVAVGTTGVAANAQRITAPALTKPARPRAHPADSSSASVPWYAPLASLAVPGAGQALLRQNRAVAYLAVDLYAFVGYRAELTEAVRNRDRYRALSHDVARAIAGDPRPVGPWDYYEAMEHYVASGAFDRVPGGDVDPEIDETTFNGSIWRLARETYWADPAVEPPHSSPAYLNAISLYLQRAVQSSYAWSWRNAALEHDLYVRAIRRSNDSYRRARTQLGVMIANHLLSMADAFATVRLRYPSALSSDGLGVEVSVPLAKLH